jgi:hypothetical protein
MHLRMFEMAVDYVRQNMSDEYEVIGGYMSPVSDRYNKAGLASATHRHVFPSFYLHLTGSFLTLQRADILVSGCANLLAIKPRTGSW